MKTTILLITGACGSGKSYFVPILKDRLAGFKVRVHDFDEKISMTNEAAVDLFLTLSEDYNKNGFFTIICGGILPHEIKASKNYSSDKFIIDCCLLNVEEVERRKRLLLRNENFFLLTNPCKLPLEEWFQCIYNSAKKYNELIKNADFYIEIDNTSNFNENTINSVCSWIKSRIGEK